MNDIKKLRRLMRAAHAMQKSNPVILRGVSITQSQAVKYAWWFESFRLKLQNGIYRFSYFKTDGTIREATGTLNLELIPEDQLPKDQLPEDTLPLQGKGRERGYLPAPGVFTYYDLEKKAWRSFRCENFIGFITQV